MLPGLAVEGISLGAVLGKVINLCEKTWRFTTMSMMEDKPELENF